MITIIVAIQREFYICRLNYRNDILQPTPPSCGGRGGVGASRDHPPKDDAGRVNRSRLQTDIGR